MPLTRSHFPDSCFMRIPRSCSWTSLCIGGFLCAVFIVPPVVCGQDIVDRGLWLALFSQGELDIPATDTENLLWWYDTHARFFGGPFPEFQGIVRPGMGYKLSDNHSMWLGYAWVRDVLPELDVEENRIWQQWGWTEEFGDISTLWRSRLEQRFVSVGPQVGWRFRQLLRASKPLQNHPRLTWVAWDEIFFHLRNTDWGAVAGYNQNRVFVGMGVTPRAGSPWRTEVGYLYQQIDVPFDGANLSNHILSVNIYYNP